MANLCESHFTIRKKVTFDISQYIMKDMHFVRDWKTIRTLNREAFKLTIDPINRSLAVI